MARTIALERLAAILSLATASGAVGGVVVFLIQNLFWWSGLTRFAHVTFEPHFDEFDLYSHVFWGAVFGLVFLINLRFIHNFWGKALIYGLFPAFARLFVWFPFIDHQGVGGWDYGSATPVFTLIFFTLAWAVPAYAWFINASRETVGEDAAQPLLVDP